MDESWEEGDVEADEEDEGGGNSGILEKETSC